MTLCECEHLPYINGKSKFERAYNIPLHEALSYLMYKKKLSEEQERINKQLNPK